MAWLPSAVVDALGDRRRLCRWLLQGTASSLIVDLPLVFGRGLPFGFGFLRLSLSASLFDVARTLATIARPKINTTTPNIHSSIDPMK